MVEIYLEYLRKSREDLEYEKNNIEYKTLERHRERLKIITENSGKPVLEENIFEEVISGDSIEKRPEIQKLLKRIEDPNIKGVWVIDVQRLCRGDLGDQDKIIKTFKYTNTLILTPEKEYNLQLAADEEYLIDKLSYSRKEYNNTKKRLVEGRKDSVLNGCFTNSTAPFGYERYKLKGQKGWSLKIIPEQAEIIKLIFKMCLEGYGTYMIAQSLNKMNIKSPTNREWRKNGIREMLRNETYAGYVKWQKSKYITTMENGKIKNKTIRQTTGNYLIAKGKHEAIINEEDFNSVQKKLKSCSTKYVKPNSTLKNPLAGILRCSKCGLVMARRDPGKNVYYSPRGSKLNPTYYPGKPLIQCTHSCVMSHSLDKVEILLIDSLKEWLTENKKLLINYQKNSDSILNDIIDKINVIKKQIEKEEIKLDKLKDFLEEGIYDKKTYLERSNLIQNTIDSLNIHLGKITAENEQIKMEKIKNVIPKIEVCINQYFNMSVKEKNELLHSILEKVYYTKTNKNDLKLDIYVKI